MVFSFQIHVPTIKILCVCDLISSYDLAKSNMKKINITESPKSFATHEGTLKVHREWNKKMLILVQKSF